MGKEKDEKDPPEIPWSPDKPMADDGDEEEVQRRAKAEARKAYLIGQYAADPKKKEKKPGERRSLFGS
jgi:hypothetical protein